MSTVGRGAVMVVTAPCKQQCVGRPELKYACIKGQGPCPKNTAQVRRPIPAKLVMSTFYLQCSNAVGVH